jgi:hypothetical protein
MLQIVAAAIKTDDGVVHSLPRPHRHHHIVHALAKADYPGWYSGDRQGFLTSDGEYVMRKDALRIAIQAGQTTQEKALHQLFSEDLW